MPEKKIPDIPEEKAPLADARLADVAGGELCDPGNAERIAAAKREIAQMIEGVDLPGGDLSVSDVFYKLYEDYVWQKKSIAEKQEAVRRALQEKYPPK